MDVKCDRCGTEYEIDDSRVTEDGVSVKCNSCGYLFRIRKKSAGVVQPPAPQDTRLRTDVAGRDRLWMVRKPDGTILVFKDLAVLQKWISENNILRDDEISRTGENWKRLGDIAELASFFQLFDQTKFQPTYYSQPSSPPGAPSSSQPILAHPQGAPIFARSFPSNPLLAVGGGRASTPPPVAATPSTPLVVPAGPAAISHPLVQPLAPVPKLSTIQNDRGEPDSWGDLEAAEIEEDVVEKWKRRGRRKWFFIVPLALIVIGIGVAYVVAPVEFQKLARSAAGIEMEEASPATQAQKEIVVDEKKNDVENDAATEPSIGEKTEESAKPIEPATTARPAESIESVKQVGPIKPGVPVKPIAPAKPTTYDGWMGLADRLQRSKRIKEALAAYDAALALKAEDVEALTGKGQCLMDIGAYPAAMALFQRALRSHPRYGDALIGLAEAHKRQGNNSEAVNYYQKYLDLMPDGPDAALAIENINELKDTQ